MLAVPIRIIMTGVNRIVRRMLRMMMIVVAFVFVCAWVVCADEEACVVFD